MNELVVWLRPRLWPRHKELMRGVDWAEAALVLVLVIVGLVLLPGLARHRLGGSGNPAEPPVSHEEAVMSGVAAVLAIGSSPAAHWGWSSSSLVPASTGTGPRCGSGSGLRSSPAGFATCDQGPRWKGLWPLPRCPAGGKALSRKPRAIRS
jgi:hypothetical protein